MTPLTGVESGLCGSLQYGFGQFQGRLMSGSGWLGVSTAILLLREVDRRCVSAHERPGLTTLPGAGAGQGVRERVAKRREREPGEAVGQRLETRRSRRQQARAARRVSPVDSLMKA